MVFPAGEPAVAAQAVSVSSPRSSVARLNTRLPLSPYCNPPSAPLRQSRRFPQQNDPTLILFCRYGFQKQYRQRLWPKHPAASIFFPRHTHSRQATLHTAHDSVHCLAGSYLVRTRTGPCRGIYPSSHKKRSPRKPGRILHAIGVRPGSLTPSTHPKLGVKSRHQGLHRYALQRIFRPFLGASRLD